MNIQLRTILLGLLSIGFAQGYAQTFALQVKDDRITYLNDEQGNRILDFSYCGYKGSEQDIPSVRNAVFVPWTAGDNTSRIQRAIDYVASLVPDASGFRGAVLLDQGEFSLSGSLRINASGIVLRGVDKEKTILAGSLEVCSGKCEDIGSCFRYFIEKGRSDTGGPSVRQRMDCFVRM